MEEPPSGISIHGLLRPAFVDENSKEELQKDENFGNGTSYYKLEMIKLQLISAHGNQVLDDFNILPFMFFFLPIKSAWIKCCSCKPSFLD